MWAELHQHLREKLIVQVQVQVGHLSLLSYQQRFDRLQHMQEKKIGALGQLRQLHQAVMRLISVSVNACCPGEKGLRARALADPKQQQLQQRLWQSALLQQVGTLEGQAEWLQVLRGHVQAAAVLCVPKRSGTD